MIPRRFKLDYLVCEFAEAVGGGTGVLRGTFENCSIAP